MTQRQRQLLDFIAAFVGKHGFSPSFDEMAAAIGVKSKSNIHVIIAALKLQGRVTCAPRCHRSVDVIGGAAIQPVLSDHPALSHFATETLMAELTQRGVFSL